MNNFFNAGINSGYTLAVEDSLVQAKRLEYFFRSNNLRYKLCPTGEEALSIAKNEPPELIISDIVMPGMNGYELCTKIKSDPQLLHIPVILLTSLQDPQDIIKGLQAGADNFITKPYDEKYLLSRIQYLIINREFRSYGSSEMIIELIFRGEKYFINSDKKQILDLLLSVYEAAIQRNDELVALKSQLEIANENLKQANSDLESFSHTVSHDLKTPLNGIIGFTDILLSCEKDNLCEESYECLQYIKESAWEMSALIQDLLHFSRAGTVDIKEELVDLSQIAKEVADSLSKREKTRTVSWNIQSGIMARADQKMMRVVFNNLLGNAFKYSSTVENALIEFGSKIEYGQQVFFVSDNGIGFNMDQAHKLFKPFQRLHSSSQFKGTGIGLSTVSRIVEKHGGQIWAESQPGMGSKFFFTVS